MAKKTAAKVSRRPVSAPKKKKKKGLAPRDNEPKVAKVVSPEVAETKSEMSKLSKSELVYFYRITELKQLDNKSSVLLKWDIGQQLLECKRKYPKSGADEIIRNAVKISPQEGRNYRLLAEKYTTREELESYAAMTNKETGWSIPWSTFLLIARIAPTKTMRRKIVNETVANQYSDSQFKLLFGSAEDIAEEKSLIAGESNGKAITAAGGLRKLRSVAERDREVIESLDEYLDDIRESDFLNNHIDELLSTMDALNLLGQVTARQLEALRDIQGEIAMNVEARAKDAKVSKKKKKKVVEEVTEVEDDYEEYEEDYESGELEDF